jgi:hypothetical protein
LVQVIVVPVATVTFGWANPIMFAAVSAGGATVAVAVGGGVGVDVTVAESSTGSAGVGTGEVGEGAFSGVGTAAPELFIGALVAAAAGVAGVRSSSDGEVTIAVVAGGLVGADTVDAGGSASSVDNEPEPQPAAANANNAAMASSATRRPRFVDRIDATAMTARPFRSTPGSARQCHLRPESLHDLFSKVIG